MKFAVFGVNFGMPQKSRTKTHEIPAAHPLAGGAVLVAVVGPSPGRGEGKRKKGKKRCREISWNIIPAKFGWNLLKIS